MPTGDTEFTGLLAAWATGDGSARERVITLVYDKLRRIAVGHMRRERKEHTLQPTALVNEALLRFVGQTPVPMECREQFLAMLSRTMRRVLVDHARKRLAEKRGASDTHVEINEDLDGKRASQFDVLAMNEALERLAAMDPRQAEIVEMRVFGGFEVAEVASMLGLSPATVKRDWT